MSKTWSRHFGVFAVLLGTAAAAGCSGGGHNSGFGGDAPDSGAATEGGGDDAGSDGGSLFGNTPGLKAITISPLTAAITSNNGAKATQAFTVTGQYSDGSVKPISSGISWTTDSPQIGAVDGKGLFTANGTLGAVVHVSASIMGQTASAALTVKLLVQSNVANAPPTVQAGLEGATTPDATVVWSYPYDATVFPRGLDSPVLMWNGGAASDVYYVHITDPTFEYQGFFTTPQPAQLSIPAANWTQFVGSTSGPAKFTMARFDGTSDTVIANLGFTIAPASMRGTIYYWANNLGRIMRLDPGAAPLDFSVGVVPAPTDQCTMACHTVAANGSSMLAAGGTFGGTYDLKSNAMGYSVGSGENSGPIRQWGLSAMSPLGDIVVVNTLMDQLTGLTADGVYQTGNGMPVANSGISSELAFMPAFSPDGSSLVFVTGSNPGTGFWLATGAAGGAAPADPTWGWLKAYAFNDTGTPMFSGERPIIGPGTDPTKNIIAWPTVTPDGRWAIYARMGWVDPSTQHNLSSYPPVVSDLYMADLKNPGVEIRLGNLDGDNTMFSAGARDLGLNFEPSVAPVASGGYFWVVMHSRRTYGNILTGDRTTEKQLWVAAIDQNPTAGKDPSHPAFWIPGQDTTTLNLRGFWALTPCKANGQGCSNGTDCCGGYCADDADAGALSCRSTPQGCSQNGDKCTQTSDCCGATAGVTCVAHVCSEPTPQ